MDQGDPGTERAPRPRRLDVPGAAAGMRLDRFLARRFADRSRSWLARGVRAGLVTDADGRALRPSSLLRGGEVLLVYLPGIAPSSEPPPMPPILHEDERLAVLDKPAGLLAHPAGTDFTWAVVGLARAQWPDHRVDLVHRLDRDTSGVLVVGKDLAATAFLKEAFKRGRAIKHYEAFCKGLIGWDRAVLDGPIGSADGVIRIQMAVDPTGLPARTDVEVLARQEEPIPLTRVRCRLHTGRTHQIRVHLAHAGHPILGDRMYGVAPEVFLRAWEQGVDRWVVAQAGAPRQALHAVGVRLPHPNGEELEVTAPLPPDMVRWWSRPAVLPHDE